ncbi:MAG: DUF533 domain-containing protein [Xylophilus ampelinus]
MTDQDRKATLTLCLMAAFADGDKHDRERDEVRRIADALAGDGSVHLAALYQDVLLRRAPLEDVARQLGTPEARRLAYEMAVCVCDADGRQTEAERAFLGRLHQALDLAPGAADDFAREAEALAEAPLRPLDERTAAAGPAAALGAAASAAARAAAGAAASPSAQAAPAGPVGAASAPPDGSARASRLSEAEIDKAILDAAILNGALELLPETLSTLAIIPLQTRLVYRIGQSYGYELDRGHVKDFLATAGVGLTSQYLEQAGRKLLGGLLGKVGGGLLGGVGKQAVSSGMSFASTWALGQVARRYYAGGRTLSAPALKQAFSGLLGEAQQLQSRYLPAIQEKARTVDVQQVLSMVRGR